MVLRVRGEEGGGRGRGRGRAQGAPFSGGRERCCCRRLLLLKVAVREKKTTTAAAADDLYFLFGTFSSVRQDEASRIQGGDRVKRRGDWHGTKKRVVVMVEGGGRGRRMGEKVQGGIKSEKRAHFQFDEARHESGETRADKRKQGKVLTVILLDSPFPSLPVPLLWLHKAHLQFCSIHIKEPAPLCNLHI